MAPIITTTRAAIATILDSLTDTSYNLNWGNNNEIDEAFIDWDKYDASGLVGWEGEDNLDDPDGAHAGAYINNVLAMIRVRVPLKDQVDIPDYDIFERFELALDDLKQAFGGSNTNGYIYQYDNARAVRGITGGVFAPKYMDVSFHFEYTQDRTDPEIAGDA